MHTVPRPRIRRGRCAFGHLMSGPLCKGSRRRAPAWLFCALMVTTTVRNPYEKEGLNMNFRRTHLAILSTAALAATSGHLMAGPLTPPVGPIASTMKSLTEVEPRIAINATNTPGDALSLFKINQPGSYYLTGNITGVSGKHGIVIASANVTLDLNGFSVLGTPGSLSGIASGGTIARVTVRNGFVRNWGVIGVNLAIGSVESVTLEDLESSANGGGFSVPARSDLRECRALDNAGVGFEVGSSFTLRQCTARNNISHGFSTAATGVIERCLSSGNTGRGLSVASDATIVGVTTHDNGGSGIFTGDGCTIVECAASSNSSVGIEAAGACVIERCVTRNNESDGIRVTSANIVRGNTSAGNGQSAQSGVGIRVMGASNRLEDNNCAFCDVGFTITFGGNFLTGNTASQNTSANWSLVAGNKCLVVSGVAAGAFNGNSGGTSPGSADPNANFTY